jgi:hypothetical protein
MKLRRADVPTYLLERHGLRIARTTLDKMFSLGGGPPCSHFGRIPYYDNADLDAWVAERLSAPRRTSSEPRQPSEKKSGAKVA